MVQEIIITASITAAVLILKSVLSFLSYKNKKKKLRKKLHQSFREKNKQEIINNIEKIKKIDKKDDKTKKYLKKIAEEENLDEKLCLSLIYNYNNVKELFKIEEKTEDIQDEKKEIKIIIN